MKWQCWVLLRLPVLCGSSVVHQLWLPLASPSLLCWRLQSSEEAIVLGSALDKSPEVDLGNSSCQTSRARYHGGVNRARDRLIPSRCELRSLFSFLRRSAGDHDPQTLITEKSQASLDVLSCGCSAGIPLQAMFHLLYRNNRGRITYAWKGGAVQSGWDLR